ncbi:MAG: AAA family ATPase [Propionibacteriaceae bacterium]|nr:AAA family ATPase [Propionibacteriaceae bacterium]
MSAAATFLARTDEINRFKLALEEVTASTQDGDWSTVILVHGLGGIGKSSLLRRLAEEVAEPTGLVWLDFEDERRDNEPAYGGEAGPGLLAVFNSIQRACLEELGRHGDRRAAESCFADFRKAVGQLSALQNRAVMALDEAKREGTAKDKVAVLEKSVLALGSLLTGEPFTVAAAAVGALSAAGQAALTRQGWRTRLLGTSRLNASDYELVTDPHHRLATLFGEAIAEISGLRPLVIMLDTAEIVQAHLGWLRVAISAAGGRVMWVIGIRLEQETSAEPSSPIATLVQQVPESRLRLMPLTRFDAHTVRSYLVRRIPDLELDEQEHARVIEFTRGLPLAVSLVARLIEDGLSVAEACAEFTPASDALVPAEPGAVVRDLARRFLVHAIRAEETHDKTDLHRLLCLAVANSNPARQPAVLRALWGTEDDLKHGLTRLAQRYDFVLSSSYRLHDDVRDVVRTYLLEPLERDRIRPSCERAAQAVYRELERKAELLQQLSDRLEDTDYQALLLDYVWYSFWADPQRGWQVVLSILPLLAARNSEEALLAQVAWFARRGSRSDVRQLERLTEDRRSSLLPRTVAKLRGMPVPASIGLRLSQAGLDYLGRYQSGEEWLCPENVRKDAMSVLYTRQVLSENPSLAAMQARYDDLRSRTANPDQALAAPIAEALMSLAAQANAAESLALAGEAALLAEKVSACPTLFLASVAITIQRSQNSDLAQLCDDLYHRAFVNYPDEILISGNYANFLTNLRKDYDQAEKYYLKAIANDPNHVVNLGNYAAFLKQVRRDYGGAEEYCRRALASDPNAAWILGNYAQLCFIRGRDSEGTDLALRALGLASAGEEPLLAECHFYLFAHSEAHRVESGTALKELLARGISTGEWDFSQNLERLQRAGDHRYRLLACLAQALRAGDSSGLQAYPEWQQLPEP